MRRFARMFLAIVPSAGAVLVAYAAQSGLPPHVALRDLTLKATLPAGCELVPAPSARLDGNRVSVGLWGNLPITVNPWTGAERPVIALIRQTMYGSTESPDGPPLSSQEANRYFLRGAEGIDEGYAAFYQQHGAAGPPEAVVFALRFQETGILPQPPPVNAPGYDDFAVRWFGANRTVARIHGFQGDRGSCYQAVARHLESLFGRR